MKLEDLRQFSKILLVGYGVEGQSTHKFLQTVLPNIEIGIADQKDGPDYLDKQKYYDFAIRSPGVRKELIWIPYTTATNIFFGNVLGTVVGVTGSKGKSTTASLIHAILKQAGLKSHLVGNIGQPMLTELLQTNEAQDIYVCELSSYQLDDIQYSPHISVILNLFPEHMDYHGNIEKYTQAKERVIAFTTAKDFFVYNPKYPKLSNLAQTSQAQSIPFIDKLPFDEEIIPLIGKHNVENVLAAVTVAKILKISEEDITEAVKNFQPLPHRLEKVGTYKGITFYDDAIATTPEATICAIETLPNISTIFLGGTDRGYDFTQLAQTITKHNIPNVILFPESGRRILSSLKTFTQRSSAPQSEVGLNPPNPLNILPTTGMEEAVKFAYEHSPKGSTCLLSTASPSYSLWKNYEEKGGQFQYFVKKIGSQLRT